MSDGFMEFGFGSGDDAVGRKSEKFKGEAGRTYRVSFCWWPGIEDGKMNLDAETPKFVGAKRFYFEGVGYIIDGGPEMQKLAGNPPRLAITTVLVLWPTNNKGAIDKDRLRTGDFKVLPWIFSEDKYRSFSPVHAEFPFSHHDLTIQCTDSKFQKMTFSPCRDNLLRKMTEKDAASEHVARIIADTQRIIGNIRGEIGREMNLDTLREKLGHGGGGGGGGGAATASGSSGATADIDALVDDILD